MGHKKFGSEFFVWAKKIGLNFLWVGIFWGTTKIWSEKQSGSENLFWSELRQTCITQARAIRPSIPTSLPLLTRNCPNRDKHVIQAQTIHLLFPKSHVTYLLATACPRQPTPFGLATSLSLAHHSSGDRPFIAQPSLTHASSIAADLFPIHILS